MQRILHYNVFCHNRAFLDPCERFADDPCWYVHLVVYYVLILVEKLCSLLLYINFIMLLPPTVTAQMVLQCVHHVVPVTLTVCGDYV